MGKLFQSTHSITDVLVCRICPAVQPLSCNHISTVFLAVLEDTTTVPQSRDRASESLGTR